MQSYDVVVVGGGMVGLSFALALKHASLSVAVLDSQPGDRPLSEKPELRVSAISLASQTIFQNVGVWDSIAADRLQPYVGMEVWDQDSFGRITFDRNSVGQRQLGYIIENQSIRRNLWQQCADAKHIDLMTGTRINKLVFGQQEAFISLDNEQMMTARLIVGADGANSYVREQAALPITFWDYEHRAIVATIRTQLPHNGIARQVFTPSGPLAFLPLFEEHLSSIVWSQESQKAEQLLALDNSDFEKQLSVAFNNQLGLCRLESERQSFPLKMRYARDWVKDRVALVGDAAHTIHPLAGQGVNLGLLDAASLAQEVMALAGDNKDIGLAKHLRHYERWRKTEAIKMIGAMEGFKRLFEGDNPLKKLVRDLGLTATDKLPFAKQRIIRHAMGLDGELPDLAKTS